MINLEEKYERTKKAEDKIQAKYHIWPEGSGGCSQIEKCPTSRSQQLAGIKFPVKIIHEGWHGITKERGGMRTGTSAHEDIGLSLEIDFLNHKDTDPEYKDLEYHTEVYVTVPITKDYTAISPIDFLYGKKGAVGRKMIHFKDFKEYMPVIMDPSKVYMIIDGKSGGDFNYYQHLVDGKIPADYLAQFHVYMKGSGQKQLSVFAFHKQYGRTKSIIVKWNDKVWEHMVKMQKRVDVLTKKFKKGEKVKLTKADLSCLWDTDNIDWYSCPLSHTYEERDVYGKPSLHLLKPCEPACKILKKKAKAQFVKLTKWKRGNSHVRIIKGVGEVEPADLVNYLNFINTKRKKSAEKKGTEYVPLRPKPGFKIGEYVMSKNKSGTNFVDTIYDAFKKFKEMDEE